MKGANEIRVNQATLIEALQEYFDKRAAGLNLVVTGVEYTVPTSMDSQYFIVKCGEKREGAKS